MIGFGEMQSVTLVAPGARTATLTTPNGQDVRDYTGEVAFRIISTGATAGATSKCRVRMTTGPTATGAVGGTGFEYVDGVDLTIDTTAVNAIYRVEKNKLKRYVSAALTVSTTASESMTTAVVLEGWKATST